MNTTEANECPEFVGSRRMLRVIASDCEKIQSFRSSPASMQATQKRLFRTQFRELLFVQSLPR